MTQSGVHGRFAREGFSLSTGRPARRFSPSRTDFVILNADGEALASWAEWGDRSRGSVAGREGVHASATRHGFRTGELGAVVRRC